MEFCGNGNRNLSLKANVSVRYSKDIRSQRGVSTSLIIDTMQINPHCLVCYFYTESMVIPQNSRLPIR